MKIIKPIQLLLLICIAVALSSCGVDVLTCETSPDGKMEVCAFTKRIGDHNTYVTLTEKQSRKEMKIMKTKNVNPISFRWVDSGELYVEGIPNQSQVEYVKQGVMGVKVNIVPQE